MVFLGFFILQAAESEVQYALVSRAFQPYAVRALMTVNPVRRLTRADAHRVCRHGRPHRPARPTRWSTPTAALPASSAYGWCNQIPPDDRSSKFVRRLDGPRRRSPVLAPSTPMMEALSALRDGLHRAVVVEFGKVIGILFDLGRGSIARARTGTGCLPGAAGRPQVGGPRLGGGRRAHGPRGRRLLPAAFGDRCAGPGSRHNRRHNHRGYRRPGAQRPLPAAGSHPAPVQTPWAP